MDAVIKCMTLLLLLIGQRETEGAKIMMIFNAPSKSHYILGEAIGVGLAARGHKVTMVSPYKVGKDIANYDEIVLDTDENMMSLFQSGNDDDGIKKISPLNMLTQIKTVGTKLSMPTLENSKIKALIKSGAKFDAVIMESCLNDCLFGLIQQFDAIPIALSPIGGTKWTSTMTGNPSNPAYIPNPFLKYTSNMSFTERLINMVMSLLQDLFFRFHMSAQQQIYKDYFGPLNEGKELVDLEVLIRNVSLMLLNTHHSVGYPMAYLPNVVAIGGVHVKTPDPLPKDILDFVGSAKDGVIYFSLGSNLKSADLGVEKRDAILKVFGNLKQKVLWKWEDANLPGKPKNVFIGSWMPQQSILAHPNVKLFITHGGLLSSIESLYFGKPMVGIPIFGDQHLNMAKAESSGYGLSFQIDDLTVETFSAVLEKVLEQPSYTENAKRLSAIFRDEPMTGLEKAIYHIEYVLRHKGAMFLRSPSVDMPLYQVLLLDVLGCFCLIFGAIFFILYVIIKKICQKTCGNTKNIIVLKEKKFK